ncbi:hypothetical protein [Streptomyces sp. ML-6]|uniref:hypothetical protein n=1 Tax=Streptomyces sp. ML-6 TaxID=2982693 RepID=UPI0024BFFF93|nr:hypothetical protein [Streptomyces sp. ML-6]MDK0524459.1 hypothetical protein [Streptomyces sp. ML-6]
MRRIRAMVLAAVLAVLVAVAPANAEDGAPAAGRAAIEPVAQSGAYPATLNAQIASFNRQLANLPSRKSLDDKQTALDGRTRAYNKESRAVLAALDANDGKIRKHNARVARYPNGAPSAVADALNAEAAALNAEQRRLKKKANKIADQGDAIKAAQKKLDARKKALETKLDTLRKNRRQLILQMATAAASLLVPPPPTSTGQQLHGGDQARPATPETRIDGGDSASGTVRNKPLDRYADLHDVEIDSRPVEAVLSPDTVAKASADNLGTLRPTRVFDGLIKKDDGTFRAVYLRNPEQPPTAEQKAFDEVIDDGGRAVAVVDGTKVLITDVQPVDAPSEPQMPQEQRNLALGLSGRVQKFAERYDYEHLMDLSISELRRELIGRLDSPNYRIHVWLKDMSKTDYPNVLARGEAYDRGERRFPFDADGKIPPYAINWERAPGVTDWEMYLIHTRPGVLERTTFYDENDNVVPSPF